jgi:hypothetical protein
MADNLASLYESQILNAVVGNTASAQFTSPTMLYVGLATGTMNGSVFPEVTGGNYSRPTMAFGTAQSATAGTISVASVTGPTIAATFPSASANWGTIEGYGLFRQATGSTGTMQYLVYGVVSPTVAVVTNDTVSFAASAMTLTMG